MTLPAKLPIKGSQIKSETGQASMKAAGAALGLGAGFKMSQLVGKTYGNWIFTPAVIVAGATPIYGLGSGKGSIARNAVGGNWGFVALLCTPPGTIALQLNNWKQTSYTMFIKNNGKTYTFTKASRTNYYQIAGAPGTEFYNLLKANAGKQLICIVTPH